MRSGANEGRKFMNLKIVHRNVSVMRRTLYIRFILLRKVPYSYLCFVPFSIFGLIFLFYKGRQN
jgi:hypothetical protein